MASQGWRVIEKSVTVGSGVISLLGADNSFRRFRDMVANGGIVTVTMTNPGKNEAEEFLATLAYGSPDTLTRLETINSTNSGAAVSWSAGSKYAMLASPSYSCAAMERLKPAVRVASVANLTLASVVPGLSVDGVTLAAGDRVALLGQTTASQNGIYVVAASGSPARSIDFFTGDTVSGASILVLAGTAFAGRVFVCTSAAGSDVVGTSSLTFATSSLVLGNNHGGITLVIDGSGNASLSLSGSATSLKIAGDTGTQTVEVGPSQTLGLYGVTPVAKRAGAAQAAVAATASTNTSPYGFTTSAQADALVTLVNELRAALVALGAIKGSA